MISSRLLTPLKRLSVIAVFLGCLASSQAATLENYQARLARARENIQYLQKLDQSDTAHSELHMATINQVKADLPAQETVMLAGQTINVDNHWLHDAVAEYWKAKSDAERSAQLALVAERLLAITQRLDELRGANASGASKDESKARLAEILRRPEYNQKPAEASAISRMWEAFIRWLLKLFPQTKPLQPGSANFISRIAQIVVLAISVGAIGLLIWKFGPRYLRHRRKKKKRREARIVLGERLEPDQTASDLLAQAEALARSGDLRAAIRKAYIALLCELGDRRIISLAQHKTNRDYLSAVRNRPSLFASMKSLTHIFELHWYGFVPAQESDWTKFRSSYDQALSRV